MLRLGVALRCGSEFESDQSKFELYSQGVGAKHHKITFSGTDTPYSERAKPLFFDVADRLSVRTIVIGDKVETFPFNPRFFSTEKPIIPAPLERSREQKESLNSDLHVFQTSGLCNCLIISVYVHANSFKLEKGSLDVLQ